MPAFAEAGVKLYAISYDEPDALADYARAHGATFPLLSDPDSDIIRRFGILNTLIDPDDHPWYGIPFPGSYVVDADGTIIGSFFETSLHFRASADQLLRAALGVEISLPPLPSEPEEVSVDVRLDADVAHPGIVNDLIVRFAVPAGHHLYGEPVPDGMVATSVTVDDQTGLVVRDPVLPPTTTHTLAGTGEQLQVFTGDVTIRVPIAHLARSLVEGDDGGLVLALTGTVAWQSCDDQACQLPRRERFAIEVPATGHNRPEDDRDDPNGMDVRRHLIRMTARRTDRPIGEIMASMAEDR